MVLSKNDPVAMDYEPYVCDLDPDTGSKLKVYLFRNVQNVEEIKSGVVSGEWQCACVRPALVLHPLQLAAAANRAALARARGALITRTLYAEILYNLSITKNISQSLTKFGVQTEPDLLICFVSDVADHDDDTDVLSRVQGEPRPMTDLSALTDFKQVKSAYKLDSIKGDYDLLDLIISRMMTKSFVSH